MKKTLFYLLLMAGLISCAKVAAPAVEETPAGVPMKFNITVSEDSATRASKTAWAENDVIYVFFRNLGEKYLKLTYNGSSWDTSSGGGALLDTDFSDVGINQLSAVHIPVPVDVFYKYEFFNFFNKDGEIPYTYYLSEENKAYSVEGTTVTATLSLGKPTNVVQFHIPGIQDNVSDYTLSSPQIGRLGCSGVELNGQVDYYYEGSGLSLKGFADADGAVFAGWLDADGPTDYTFTLTAGNKTYTLTRTNKTLVAGKRYNFPALDSGEWTESTKWDNNGKDYVNLGLPSGTLWATMNIGASTPSEDGDYFAWGETAQKESYFWGTYKHYDYDSGIISPRAGITKYTGSDYSVLLAGDDAAHVNWGGDWRMPTDEEWRELIENCTYELIRQDGKYVWVITGPNGNAMSLPGGGRYFEYDLLDFNSQGKGYYWSSTLIANDILSAAVMELTWDVLRMSDLARYMGALVRPVLGEITSGEPDPETNTLNGHAYVDMGDGLKWATMNVGADSPEKSGDYFAWGETAPKDDYTYATYAHMKPGKSSWKYITKYTFDDNQKDGIWYDGDTFIGDNMRSLADDDYKDDAARKEWESTWRTPTDAEWTWLLENCEWTWTNDYEDTGVAGMIVTGTTGNTIFLPAAGDKAGTELRFNGSYGYYWSSSLKETESDRAICVVIYSNDKVRNSNQRRLGYSIRPVSN